MIYLLHGTDTFRSHDRLRKLIENFRTHYPQAATLRYDAQSQGLADQLGTQSLFAEPKLIVVYEWSLTDPAQWEQVVSRLATQDPQTEIIFWEEAAKSLAEWARVLRPLATIEQFMPLQGSSLTDYLSQLVGDAKLALSPAQVKWLWDRSGQDLWQFAANATKLAALPWPPEREMVEWLVPLSADHADFAITNALLANDIKQAHRILVGELQAGAEIQRLIGGIAAQFRSLIRVHSLLQGGANPASIAQQTGIHPYVVGKMAAYKSATLAHLKQLYLRLAEVDWQIKTGAITADDAIEHFFAQLAVATSR